MCSRGWWLNEPLEVSECETKVSEDGKLVKVIFRNDIEETREVVLRRNQLPQLVSILQEHIGKSIITSIDKKDLRIGQSFAVSGFQVKPISEGGCRLILAVDLLDLGRMVTIPLDFSPKDLETLFAMIIKKEEGQLAH